MFNWRGQAKTDGPAVLDEAYLSRLAGHIGDSELRELLSDGLLELMDRVNTVDTLLQDEHAKQLGETVHDLAGMAGHLGLARLSAAAVQAERDLRAVTSPLELIMRPVREDAPVAIAALRDFLDGAKAN